MTLDSFNVFINELDTKCSHKNYIHSMNTMMGDYSRILEIETILVPIFQDLIKRYGNGELINYTVTNKDHLGTPIISLGTLIGGGSVYYIKDNILGIVGTSDIANTKYWSTVVDNEIKVKLEVLTGRSNTEKIYAIDGDNAQAAKICLDYDGGGYTDWGLPSNADANIFKNTPEVFLNRNTTSLYWTTYNNTYAAGSYGWLSGSPVGYIIPKEEATKGIFSGMRIRPVRVHTLEPIVTPFQTTIQTCNLSIDQMQTVLNYLNKLLHTNYYIKF